MQTLYVNELGELLDLNHYKLVLQLQGTSIGEIIQYIHADFPDMHIPPSSPYNGLTIVLSEHATGPWAIYRNYIGVFNNGNWLLIAPTLLGRIYSGSQHQVFNYDTAAESWHFNHSLKNNNGYTFINTFETTIPAYTFTTYDAETGALAIVANSRAGGEYDLAADPMAVNPFAYSTATNEAVVLRGMTTTETLPNHVGSGVSFDLVQIPVALFASADYSAGDVVRMRVYDNATTTNYFTSLWTDTALADGVTTEVLNTVTYDVHQVTIGNIIHLVTDADDATTHYTVYIRSQRGAIIV